MKKYREASVSCSLFSLPAKKALDLLTRLAEDSRGRAFFTMDVRETPAIATQIAKDLRAQYVISYYPSNGRRRSMWAPAPGGVGLHRVRATQKYAKAFHSEASRELVGAIFVAWRAGLANRHARNPGATEIRHH